MSGIRTYTPKDFYVRIEGNYKYCADGCDFLVNRKCNGTKCFHFGKFLISRLNENN